MSSPNQFVMESSFFAHRALMRDTEMLNAIAKRIELLRPEELSHLKKWYEFYWTMMEQHHTSEDDFIFKALEEKLNQPSEAIEIMEVEHNRIQFLIDEVKRILGELDRSGNTRSLGSELQFNTVELLRVFRIHITGEEKYIREKMTAHFSPREQRRIENEVKRKAPFRYLAYMIPWLYDSLTNDESRLLNDSLPWSAKLLNRFFRTGKYKRLVDPVKALVG